MMRISHTISLALTALLLSAPPLLARDPMPPACALLQALPDTSLSGDNLRFNTLQDRENGDIRMSMCSVTTGDDQQIVTLLLRQTLSKTAPQPAKAQRDAMIAELAKTFGHKPELTLPDIGEAAAWTPEIGQLSVWYQSGRVMFIVGGAKSEAAATHLAHRIVLTFP